MRGYQCEVVMQYSHRIAAKPDTNHSKYAEISRSPESICTTIRAAAKYGSIPSAAPMNCAKNRTDKRTVLVLSELPNS
ncbi:MAG: hypothetical protein NC394_00655 [Bacteroides sp.]|nr:hypothetical protein [Bacteroides sp.]